LSNAWKKSVVRSMESTMDKRMPPIIGVVHRFRESLSEPSLPTPFPSLSAPFCWARGSLLISHHSFRWILPLRMDMDGTITNGLTQCYYKWTSIALPIMEISYIPANTYDRSMGSAPTVARAYDCY